MPIIPGTRVTEAKIVLPEAAGARAPEFAFAAGSILGRPVRGPFHLRTALGYRGAGRDDARLQLEHEVTEWLTPEVPPQWKPPGHLITRMIRKTDVHPIVRD